VSDRIAGITRNIADSAQRQSKEASSITNTMSVIQEITGQTTEGTEQTAVSIGRLADLADELRHSVAGFRLPEDD
jgi:twitching motility protein PilJ